MQIAKSKEQLGEQQGEKRLIKDMLGGKNKAGVC